MRIVFALLACFFLLMAPAQSFAKGPQVYSQITPEQFASVLTEANHPAEVLKDKKGNKFVSFVLFPGTQFKAFAFFYPEGRAVVLRAFLPKAKANVTMSDVNNFDSDWTFGNVYLFDDGSSLVQSGIVLAGGVTSDNLVKHVAVEGGMVRSWLDVAFPQ